MPAIFEHIGSAPFFDPEDPVQVMADAAQLRVHRIAQCTVEPIPVELTVTLICSTAGSIGLRLLSPVMPRSDSSRLVSSGRLRKMERYTSRTRMVNRI